MLVASAINTANTTETIKNADSKVDEYFSLAIGNPFFGLRFVGPFGSSGEAVEYADYYRIPRDEWWVVRLERPGSVKGV